MLQLFIGDHKKIQQTCEELNLHRAGGYQKHKCYMTFEQQCKYKYLLNSASIGYANKLKYLLLCGSVVIYVQVAWPRNRGKCSRLPPAAA